MRCRADVCDSPLPCRAIRKTGAGTTLMNYVCRSCRIVMLASRGRSNALSALCLVYCMLGRRRGCACTSIFHTQSLVPRRYTAPKNVKIRDRRLGLLSIFFMLVISIYVGVYQLWYQLGYIDFLTVQTGTALLTLQAPTVDGCNPVDADCMYNFTAIDSLNYCCTDMCSAIASDGSCSCPDREWKVGQQGVGGSLGTHSH